LARTPATSRSHRLAFAVLIALVALLAYAGAAFADDAAAKQRVQIEKQLP
jgi:hypothetical protein